MRWNQGRKKKHITSYETNKNVIRISYFGETQNSEYL